jgi:hypothetical protein
MCVLGRESRRVVEKLFIWVVGFRWRIGEGPVLMGALIRIVCMDIV